jgi:2-oxoglutarate dehydrogenase E2 component (dihydrolipoamide succinyltransferase)
MSKQPVEPRADQHAVPAGTDAPTDTPVITEPARRFIAEHGIAPADVTALGIEVVRLADVEGLGGAAPETRGEPLSTHQATVARNVSLSHAAIPAAFVMTKVDLPPVAGSPEVAGLPELVVKAVAGQKTSFENCFSSLTDDHRVLRAGGAHIGVTVDAGAGLYVPVIRDADKRDLREIAAELTRQRVRALRRTVRAEDLTGAAITVSINTDPGIVLARPIVFPGQSCAVAVCAPQRELQLDENGAVVQAEYFLLGLAYDHRVINGREAMAFLAAVRADLRGIRS